MSLGNGVVSSTLNPNTPPPFILTLPQHSYTLFPPFKDQNLRPIVNLKKLAYKNKQIAYEQSCRFHYLV